MGEHVHPTPPMDVGNAQITDEDKRLVVGALGVGWVSLKWKKKSLLLNRGSL